MSDSERALLGAIFLDNSAWDAVANTVRPEDFETYTYSKVWRAMQSLSADGKPIDLITVVHECGIEPHEISDVTDSVPSSANVGYYAKMVHNSGTKRNAVRILREALEHTQQLESSSDIIEHIESRIFELHDQSGGQYRHVREYLMGAMENIEENVKAHMEGRTVGTATGLAELDDITGGLRNEDLIVIGARASIGKTALGLTIARNISKESPVGFFSLEMSGEAITQRLLAMVGKINATKLRNGTMKPADFKDLTDAAGRIQQSKLWLYDVSNARLSDIKAKARRLAAREAIQAIVVDYVGLINTDERFAQRHEKIGHIAKELKQLARELRVPVVLLAQLKRDAENRIPGLSDLAESGNLEQDADVVMLLHRERMSEDTKTMCVVAKQRNGATGIIDLAFRKEFTLFQDYSPDAEYGGYE